MVTGQAYEAGRLLADLFPTSSIVEVADHDFSIEKYSNDGKCSMLVLDKMHNQIVTSVNDVGPALVKRPLNVFLEVHWRGTKLNVVTMSVGSRDSPRHFVIADRLDTAEQFVLAVCDWNAQPRDSIAVYASGFFSNSKELMESVRSANLDQLVLAPETLEQLFAGCRGFFDQEATYTKHGIPWKRGVLLTGPPGNGKTQAVKSMINDLEKPCVYVRSFDSSCSSDEDNMSEVFERVRRIAPCVVVMEDLDSLVKPSKVSFLLNEIDGFMNNHGVLLIATTNHPERLDPALLERPSRFDRKVHFGLPAHRERFSYLLMQATKWNTEMRPDDAELDQVALATEGFSFAYLKEMCLSSMMVWMDRTSAISMGGLMLEQAAALQKQMVTKSQRANKKSKPADDDDE